MIRAILILLFSCVLNTSTQAQSARIFTNQKGVQIEAQFLDVLDGGKSVKILRVSDGREFVFPIATLIPNDQAYIAAAVKMRKASEGASHSLLVKGLKYRDRAAPFITRSTWEDTRIGNKDFRLSLPKGSAITFYTSISGVYGYFYIPYHGEKLFEFETGDDNTLWLKRDGGQKELVGVTVEYFSGQNAANARKQLRAIDTSQVKHVLSITFGAGGYHTEIDAVRGDTPLSIYYSGSIPQDHWSTLSRVNLVALNAHIESEDIPKLESLKKLQQLAVHTKNHPENEAIPFPPLPELKHFITLSSGDQVNWDDTLKGFPKLEALCVFRYANLATGGGTPATTFANNPNLKLLALNDPTAPIIKASALHTVPNLRHLHYVPNTIAGKVDDSILSKFTSLEYFSAIDPNLKGKQINEWLASGAGETIRDFGSYTIPDCSLLPKLERLRAERSSLSGDHEFENLTKAPQSLSILDIETLSNKDFEIMKLPHPESLLSLKLSSTRIDDAELLYRFPNLRKLYMSSNSGRISSIDIARLPNLEYLNLYSLDDLEKIENLTASTSLTFAALGRNKYLTDLGPAVENNSLQELNLSYLPRILTLPAFEKSSSLKRVYLSNLEKLENYSGINTSSIEYMSVRDCGTLENYLRSE